MSVKAGHLSLGYGQQILVKMCEKLGNFNLWPDFFLNFIIKMLSVTRFEFISDGKCISVE